MSPVLPLPPSSTPLSTPSPAPLNELQAFAAVARLRSFRRAALTLGVSASALSHTLRTLEERLGLRLLNRTTRSVAPTEAGSQLLEQLAPALQSIEQALDAINAYRHTPLGTVRINAPHAAVQWVLAPLMAPFLRDNPGMQLEIVANDALVDIVREGFDAGVRYGESVARDMVAIPLGPPQRFVVVGSPDYLARHGQPATPPQLAEHACIRYRFPSGALYRWEFSRDGVTQEVDVSGRLTLGYMPLVVAAARDGLGLAYVYEQSVRDDLAAGRLCTVLDDWCPPVPGFFLYYPSRQHLSAGLRAFITLVQESRPAAA